MAVQSIPNSDSSHEVPTGPIEVRPGCWLVGRRNPATLLQCNTYLRTFDGGGPPVHVCIDPGSRFDFATIEQNVKTLIGDLGEIHSFSLNHQDPDVVGNSLFLCEANPNISAVVTEDVWRLVQHLNFKPRRIHFANATRSRLMTIGHQSRWQLVPTPFCHFRGAIAFYDPELRTLFSGDLFGGLNRIGLVHAVAEETDWPGIAQFHQIYMPTREIVRYAVRQIRAIDPPVEIIAPQHGHIITGDLVPLFLECMYDLPVGHDMLAIELDESYLTGYREVLARVLALADVILGRDEVLHRLGAREPDDGLRRFIRVTTNEIVLEREGYTAMAEVLERLSRSEPSGVVNLLKSELLRGCTDLALPIPPVGIGIEGDWAPESIGSDGISLRPT